jgi:hypothetical protein
MAVQVMTMHKAKGLALMWWCFRCQRRAGAECRQVRDRRRAGPILQPPAQVRTAAELVDGLDGGGSMKRCVCSDVALTRA